MSSDGTGASGCHSSAEPVDWAAAGAAVATAVAATAAKSPAVSFLVTDMVVLKNVRRSGRTG